MLPSVGVVDTGNSSRILLPLLRSAGFTVSGIWGSSKQQAQEMAQEYEVPFHTCKIDELLLREDVDLVCVLSPPHIRTEVAVKALSIGKHVLCDSPAGLSKEEAVRIVNAAQYYPKLLSLIRHELRFLPAYLKMKQYLKEEFCGEPLICECRIEMGSLLGNRYNWMCDQAMGGGVLANVGAHIIDIISFLTNQRAVEVQGTLKTFVTQSDKISSFRHISSDDYTAFQMKLNGGVFATVTLNSHIPGRYSQILTIYGTKGQLIARNGSLYGMKNGGKEELIHGDTARIPGIFNVEKLPPSIFLTGLEAWVSEIKRAFEESCNKDDRRIADLQTISSAASFVDGLYTRAVLDAVIESSRTSSWCGVDDISNNDLDKSSGSSQDITAISREQRKEMFDKKETTSPVIRRMLTQ